jgi:hypothetical protein
MLPLSPCGRGSIVTPFQKIVSGAAPTRRTITAMLASAPALALGGCSTRPRTIRYRLTLEVETPDGMRSGASVVELKTTFQDGLLGGIASNSLISNIRGEASVVDLGARGLLFCLLTGDPSRPGSVGAERVAGTAFPMPRPPQTRYDSSAYLAGYFDDLNRRLPKTEFAFELLPLLVRFRDIADPKSVERVDPDDLEKSFGPGVRLKRATIEITDDAVTTGIEKRLGWLQPYPEPSLSPAADPFRDPLHPPFASTVHHGDFRRGLQ